MIIKPTPELRNLEGLLQRNLVSGVQSAYQVSPDPEVSPPSVSRVDTSKEHFPLLGYDGPRLSGIPFHNPLDALGLAASAALHESRGDIISAYHLIWYSHDREPREFTESYLSQLLKKLPDSEIHAIMSLHLGMSPDVEARVQKDYDSYRKKVQEEKQRARQERWNASFPVRMMRAAREKTISFFDSHVPGWHEPDGYFPGAFLNTLVFSGMYGLYEMDGKRNTDEFIFMGGAAALAAVSCFTMGVIGRLLAPYRSQSNHHSKKDHRRKRDGK